MCYCSQTVAFVNTDTILTSSPAFAANCLPKTSLTLDVNMYLFACLLPFFCMLLIWDCSRIFVDVDSIAGSVLSYIITPSFHLKVVGVKSLHVHSLIQSSLLPERLARQA